MTFYSEFAACYERIFPFNPDVTRFLEMHLPDPPGRVLDVGCGTGAYAGHLAKRGFDVIGIDLDPSMIRQAQAGHPEARFRVLDMRDIGELESGFQVVYCIGNTAAHLPQDDFVGFLRQVYRILSPGGIWLLQIMNWDYVLTQERVTFPVLRSRDDSLAFYRVYQDISPAQVTFATRLERSGHIIFEAETTLYPLRWVDLYHLHGKAGFDLEAHLGSFGGAAFDEAVFSANISVWRRIGGSEARSGCASCGVLGPGGVNGVDS